MTTGDEPGRLIPRPWLKLLQHVAPCVRSEDEFARFFDEILTMQLSGDLMGVLFPGSAWGGIKYSNWLPEFFVLASMGVDGVSYGAVIRAPELAADDFPWGEFSPMDDEPISLLGLDTLDALRNLAAEAVLLRDDELDDEEDASESDSAAKELNLKVLGNVLGAAFAIPQKSSRFTAGGDFRKLPKPSHPGYLYVPTPDGMGVFAPDSAFEPTHRKSGKCRTAPLNDLIDAASRAMASSFPASSLLYSRAARWEYGFDKDLAPRINLLIADAYDALGRHYFASQMRAL